MSLSVWIERFFGKEGMKFLTCICLSSLMAWVVMCFVFPDLYVFHRIEFIRFVDMEFCYQGVFTLLNNFYHGGIGLWNSFDQMPLSFHHLNGGLYTLTNITTALAYVLLSPFFQDQAESFHRIYSTVFFASPFLIRSAGAYLLVRRFTSDFWLLLLSGILVNTLLVPQMHMGLSTTDLYNFFPLLMHFILRFVEEFRLNHFLIAITLFVIGCALNPLVAPGYFYLGVHFFVISCLLWAIVFNRTKMILAWNQAKSDLKDIFIATLRFLSLRHPAARLRATCSSDVTIRSKTILKILFTLVLCLIIIAPSVYMLKVNWNDYEFGADKSRFNDMFSLKAYFERPFYAAPQKEFFWRMVDFSRNAWDHSWVYVGFLTVFLTSLGLFLSRDSLKYIFLITIVFFFLINSPREASGLNALAQWMNALTNPFKFLARSFHMTGAFLLSFLLLPLMIQGIKALYSLNGKALRERANLFRLALFLVVMGFLLINVWPQVSLNIRQYLLKGLFIGMSILGIVFFVRQRFQLNRWVLSGGILLWLLIDYAGMKIYLKQMFNQVKMITHPLEGLPEAGRVDLSLRNPTIFPHRFFYVNNPLGQVPFYVQPDSIHMQGLYFQMTDLYKFFKPVSNYKPRHRMYGFWAGDSVMNIPYTLDNWPGDKRMLTYVAADNRLLTMSSVAMLYREKVFEEILKRKWSRDVVSLDFKEIPTHRYSENLPATLEYRIEDNWQGEIKRIPLNFEEAKQDYHVAEFRLKLPDDFPRFLSSTIFTLDRQLIQVHLELNENIIPLTAAQGKLVHPLTFDVRNLSSSELRILLPREMAMSNPVVRLLYVKRNEHGLTRIFKETSDELDFNYRALHDGWLVIHVPFDKKWKITVDQRSVSFYRANKSFTSIPLKAGEHRIVMRYWPGTLLRLMIVVSIAVIFLSVWWIVGWSVREYSIKNVGST